MTFKKGQSGNPNGRPRKKRALAKIIETVGNTKVNDTAKKRLLADKVWSALIDGEFNGEQLSFSEWKALLKWLGDHLDGPVPQDVQEQQHGGEVVMRVVYGSGRDDHKAETAAPKAT